MAQPPREESRGLMNGAHKTTEFNNMYAGAQGPSHGLARALEQLTTSFQHISKSSSPALAKSILSRIGFAMIPSFIQTRLRPISQKHGELHPTAYLDGLRGLAALFVFFSHLANPCHNIVLGYGQGEPGENMWLLQLPIIRLIYSGPAMVTIFFVISGYALSYKPIKQMRSRSWEPLMGTLASSIFRRGMRLYIPCIISTFVVFILVRLGVYELTRAISANAELLTDIRTEHPFRLDTLGHQWLDYRMKVWDFIHPWSWGLYDGTISYDWHLWTIPTEFRASLALFLTQAGVARMVPWMRVTVMIGITYWALTWDRWEMILFYSGAIIAELNMMFPIRRPGHTPTASSTTSHQPGLPVHLHSTQKAARRVRRVNAWTYFWMANFFVALFIISSPDTYSDQTPGYIWLSSWIPAGYSQKFRFLQSVGAIYLVWTISNCAQLQALFTTPPVYYLGKISFALYLMHGMVTQTLGFLLFDFFWKSFGTEPRWRKEVGFACASCFVIPATIWAADIFWRLADIPSVKFARWVESLCTVGNEK